MPGSESDYSRLVIRMVSGLTSERGGPVSAADIARRAELDEARVLAELRMLKSRRIVRDRRRRGERLWEPWM